MAQGSYTTDLTTLTQNETNTGVAEPTAAGWTSLNQVTSAETDYFIQNVACTSATVKVGVGGLMYNNGAGFTIPTDGAVFCWAYFWAPGVLAVESSGGARQMIGSSLADFYYVNHLGSDSWLYGGWQCFVMADPSAITTDTQVGTPTGTIQYTGWAYNAPSAVPGKGYPFGIDAIRYGRGTLQITDGDVTEYGTFVAAAEFNDKNSTAARTGFTLLDSGYHRLGLFQYQDGAYKWQGHFLMGTAATAVDFRDSNRLIFVLNTKHVTANFNLFEVRNALSRVDWTGITVIALGTVSKGRFLVTDNADVNLSSCTFTDMDTFTFMAASAALNCIFRRTNAVTAPGSNLTGSTFETPTVAADTGALVWDVATNPDGLLDNTTFSKGTNAHHAIDFGTSVTGNITLRGCEFTGFGSTGDSNDSTVRFLATGGAPATTGNFSVDDAAGIVVTLSISPVTFSVTAKDLDTGLVIENARVMVPVTSGANFPYQASVTTITGAGTTATVTHTGHGRATGDNILIAGASPDYYNGAFTITLDGVDPINKYTYTTPVTISTSPATGTITATMVLLNGFTNASGVITDSRTYSADQTVSGWVRRHTYGPSFDTATWTDVSSTLTKTGAFTGMSGTFLITITAGTNMTPGVYLATWVNANDVTLPGAAGSADSSDVAFTIGAKPLYRQAPVDDTIPSSAGKSVTVFLQPDE